MGSGIGLVADCEGFGSGSDIDWGLGTKPGGNVTEFWSLEAETG